MPVFISDLSESLWRDDLSSDTIVCGIYYWEAINPNNSKFNGKYIGKSINIYERKLDHLAELCKNKHVNKRLQAYFNKIKNHKKLVTGKL